MLFQCDRFVAACAESFIRRVFENGAAGTGPGDCPLPLQCGRNTVLRMMLRRIDGCMSPTTIWAKSAKSLIAGSDRSYPTTITLRLSREASCVSRTTQAQSTVYSINAAGRHRTLVQSLFGVAVAALGAAFASPLVESLSNHGAFGPGSFTDGSNADVLPVTLAGLLLVAGFLGVRIRHSYFRASRTHQLHELAAAISLPRVVRMLPFIFVVQIGMLWTMETVEQHVVVGHGLGPTVWLGGPIAASLAIHVCFCIGAALLARRISIVVEPRAIRIVRAILALLVRVLGSSARPVQRTTRSIEASILSPTLRHIGKRGPPQPHLS